MPNIKILDCTLRDGGYVNNWQFPDKTCAGILEGLIRSNIDLIECGYLSKSKKNIYGTIFDNLNHFDSIRDQSLLVAMIDVADVGDIPPYCGTGIKNLRVVFYKHQIEKAKELIKDLVFKGYNVFVQPMVTVEYSIEELKDLSSSVGSVKGFSIVDSFGNMKLKQLLEMFDVLSHTLSPEVSIGFHSHNNKGSALHLALSLVKYCTLRKSDRTVIVDSSLNGMGRGPGNLQTEIICDHLNDEFDYQRYDIPHLCQIAMKYITPYKDTYAWGYDTFYFITAHLGFHPNYVRFIRDIDPLITSEDYMRFLQSLDPKYKTHCRLDQTRSLYSSFSHGILF